MDPSVKSSFEEVLRRFDSFDAKWEAKFAAAEAVSQERAAEADRRFIRLERSCAAIPMLEAHVASLDTFCSAQSEQNAVANDWGRAVERRVGELEHHADDLDLIRITEIHDERDDRVSALEGAAEVFDEWRPWVEASIYDIQREMNRSNVRASSPTAERPGKLFGATVINKSASARPSAGEGADWPSGHCEQGYGSVTTVAPPLTHGMPRPHPPLSVLPRLNPIPHPWPHQAQPCPVLPPPIPPDPHPLPAHSSHFHPNPHHMLPQFSHYHPNHQFSPAQYPQPGLPNHTPFNPAQLGRLPKLDFPKFDGDHAQFWITCAVNYFEMYTVEPQMWIRVATMHFTGAAKRWLQSIEPLLATSDWKIFCSMIHERFSRDQHELLLRQLFNICQSGSVSEYVDKFTEIIDQLKA